VRPLLAATPQPPAQTRVRPGVAAKEPAAKDWAAKWFLLLQPVAGRFKTLALLWDFDG